MEIENYAHVEVPHQDEDENSEQRIKTGGVDALDQHNGGIFEDDEALITESGQVTGKNSSNKRDHRPQNARGGHDITSDE